MKKIVVAESSPTIKSVADNLLRQNGYDVVCTSDGLQAWEVINSDRPDLVLAGLNISGINGLELCRQVTGDSKVGGIPVVVMVGAKDNIEEDELKSTGARGKLSKPFSPRDLLVVVKRLIGEGGTGQAQPSSANPSKTTNYSAEVLSTTRHLEDSASEVYNLDWSDLNETGAKIPEIPEGAPGSTGSTDDQGIEIVHDQYDLASLNEAEKENPESKAKSSEDEDYDWFIGEMKKETPNDTGAIKTGEKSANSAAPQAKPESPSNNSEAGFEDFESSNAKFFATEDKKPAKEISRPDTETVPAGTESRAISDDDISKIANKVTQNLAAEIVSKIDSQKIIDVIKTIIKQ